jgi:hypothetical protein
LIALNPPEAPDAPYRLNAKFTDRDNNIVCQVVDNEIIVRNDPWDIEIVGPTLAIRRAPGDIALSLTSLPGQGFRIDRIDTV